IPPVTFSSCSYPTIPTYGVHLQNLIEQSQGDVAMHNLFVYFHKLAALSNSPEFGPQFAGNLPISKVQCGSVLRGRRHQVVAYLYAVPESNLPLVGGLRGGL